MQAEAADEGRTGASWPVGRLACRGAGTAESIAYTTGQFLGWNHGRFHYGGPGDPANKADTIAATALGKIGTGAFVALLTTVAGTVWCTLWGTLLIWLPGRFGRKG